MLANNLLDAPLNGPDPLVNADPWANARLGLGASGTTTTVAMSALSSEGLAPTAVPGIPLDVHQAAMLVASASGAGQAGLASFAPSSPPQGVKILKVQRAKRQMLKRAKLEAPEVYSDDNSDDSQTKQAIEGLEPSARLLLKASNMTTGKKSTALAKT